MLCNDVMLRINDIAFGKRPFVFESNEGTLKNHKSRNIGESANVPAGIQEVSGLLF